MTSELIKCPLCGYKYRTNIDKIVKDGKTVVFRLCLPNINNLFSRRTTKSMFIDLACPNCKKEFEWEVKV